MNAVSTLAVHLNEVLVGYLTHYPDEKTQFVIDEGYLDLGQDRPILSLSLARPNDEASTRALLLDSRHKLASVKAPPFFSNLLPEGGLRRTIAQRLKVHEDREFLLLRALGRDLPGAVITSPAEVQVNSRGRTTTQPASGPAGTDLLHELKFSLAGMQMKFSMLRQGERLTLAGEQALGNYLVKPPSRDFEALPLVEAATMQVAQAAGIEVPEIRLVPASQIDGLPDLQAFDTGEPFYAIRRFDRPESTTGEARIHIEDFAQVFNLRPQQKYGQVNHEMIGRTLLRYAGGLADLQEMARRMVFNVLMGNGDAHIKNWSLIYRDPTRPRLAPAYDLVPTVAYMSRETSLALNMAGVKRFADITLDSFAAFLTRVGIADQVLDSVMAEVRHAGQQVLQGWRDRFHAVQVPQRLIQRIETHQAGLPLVATLGG
ncbi:type II toxin-antitoxin system HipA family toxin [Malikia spinosa]|uniref:Type II toxin-antitoxin system HipA family toxin n=1 Tax=Malikia spinosa TaxID=86180 RepID=A0A2S9KCZ9_9BURK|nr:HipA domain-containing protein [Malikia spinosa]PRD68327.1 type II toxin-antitoxin system HipA family toxin [Malikia spinosa]